MSSATLPPPDVTEPVDDAVPEVSDGWGPYRPWVRVGVVGLLVVGVVLRFVTRSPLWLDEALSVNIARLPLGDIPEALRHDGHPPLYYFLLHVWMDVFGEGDVAVRALSGLWGLALIPLTWFAGRRLGGERVAWIATLLVAVSPFAIRYSTETRMYSMVMVLVLAACLIGQDALRDPKPWRLAVIAVLVGALLLSHYWSMYLLASIGLDAAVATALAAPGAATSRAAPPRSRSSGRWSSAASSSFRGSRRCSTRASTPAPRGRRRCGPPR